MKTRFAITYINKGGARALARGNQGRNHFDTIPEAVRHLNAIKNNNSIDTLISVYGKEGVESMGVSPIECYDHGDAVGVYVDVDEVI